MRKISAVVLSASLLLPYAVFSTPVYAAVEQQKVNQPALTYDQVIQKALSSSYTLRNSQENINQSKEALQKSADNVHFFPAGPGNPGVDKAFTGYAASQINYSIAKKQLTIEEDKIAYSARKAYNDVLQAMKEKELAEESLSHDQLLRNIASAKYQAGLSSKVERTKAIGSYEADKKNLDAAEKGLVAAYQKLNQLIGLRPEARPQLAEQLSYTPMPETDLESHISRVISENPSLWNADKAIELKQLSVDLYTFNDLTSTETYESRKMDVTKASNTYADAKEQTEKGLRDLYQSIRKAEDSYEAIQESLTVAEEALQATKVQFDVGMATRADLSERELTIAQLKEKLATLTVSHDNAVQAFFKPWAAGSSAQ